MILEHQSWPVHRRWLISWLAPPVEASTLMDSFWLEDDPWWFASWLFETSQQCWWLCLAPLRCPPRPLLPLHLHSPPQADSGFEYARSKVPALMSVTYFHDLDPQIHQNLCWTQTLQNALMKSDFDLRHYASERLFTDWRFHPPPKPRFLYSHHHCLWSPVAHQIVWHYIQNRCWIITMQNNN